MTIPLTIQLIPPAIGASHTHTVVFLHGRGSTAVNFSNDLSLSRDSKGYTLTDLFPTVRWIFPQANISPCVTRPGERISQWFDVWDATNLADHEELQAEGLKESVDSVRAIIEREAAKLGGRWERIILMGISQGGATCVHILLNLRVAPRPPPAEGDTVVAEAPPRLGAFVGFCTRMPFPGRTLAETRAILGLSEDMAADNDQVVRNTPVLLQHCADDRVVKIESGRELRDTLQRFGARVTWQEYAEGGHWLHSPEGIENCAAWLKEHVFNN
ncbi:acyl-protein thioesterase [Diplogelasinospora grovesii]|uniref:Acyl-protein thioesterase n=1 Tax=Diplogelasinospora grovesii TaxID=303347 RepID=A0AAN6S7W9_9PEZI|nr:acyl-protein thioesterase [Diplogelasinospora grovesii]